MVPRAVGERAAGRVAPAESGHCWPVWHTRWHTVGECICPLGVSHGFTAPGPIIVPTDR